MTDFSLWDELGVMYYAPINVNPEGEGEGMWAKGGDLVKRFVNFLRVGRGIILTDRQEIFISHTFRLNVTNKGAQALFS